MRDKSILSRLQEQSSKIEEIDQQKLRNEYLLKFEAMKKSFSGKIKGRDHGK